MYTGMGIYGHSGSGAKGNVNERCIIMPDGSSPEQPLEEKLQDDRKAEVGLAHKLLDVSKVVVPSTGV